MPIVFRCRRCNDELDDPGAILLGPPEEDGRAKKDHLCTICYDLIYKICFE